MDLLEKYNLLMNSKGNVMLGLMAKLTDLESRYINAKLVIDHLEFKLENPFPDPPKFHSPEEIKKQIVSWTNLILELESKQDLATS